MFSGSLPGLFGDDGSARRNNLGHNFLACENGKIRSDGYLIGWQYYLKTVSNQCSFSSYVTIFRKGNESEYSELHTALTQLQPLKPLRDGINFQFVQKTLILVKVGDVIGTYT